MPRVRDCLCLPFALLSRRLRIPFTQRSIPVFALVLVGVIVGVPVGGIGLALTNQPIFCSSCHEMSLHYATWQESSHRSVTCEECHVMPGMVSMFKSKLAALRQIREHAKGGVTSAAIQGHVPSENCQRCHKETPELVTYHGLKITHRDHWSMEVDCTYCHDRVVHGPKWLYEGVSSTKRIQEVSTAFTFSPTMEGCFRCHDGKKASNECSTCHVTLGERKPTVFDPAWVQAHTNEVRLHGEDDCQRCHQQVFCDACHRSADPHPTSWVSKHPKEAKKNPKACQQCHLAPAEKAPRKITDMAFCRACHGLRQEHKQADWEILHGSESLSNPQSCVRCHAQSWCSDCHAISRPHPQQWLTRHPAEANRGRQKCSICHTNDYCTACHQNKEGIPASHTSDWLSRHHEQARRGDMSCRTCHEEQFCQSCHAQKAPASHGKRWMSQHGSASESQFRACLLCHKESQCNQCHGLTMPHPKLWLASHHKQGAEQKQLCDQCHRKESCDACHRGAFPASHQPTDWLDRHGAQAKQSKSPCSLCHRDAFCNSCHGTPMPHPKDWRKTGHGNATSQDSKVCARCHRESSCINCHGLAMPHPDSWLGKEHGQEATASPDICARCHDKTGKDCLACHQWLPPDDHGNAEWSNNHMMAGVVKPALCGYCHGENACVTCHAKRK